MSVNPNSRFPQPALWMAVKSGKVGSMFALCAAAHCTMSTADLPLWKGC